MIRSTATVDTSGIDGLIEFIKNQPQVIQRVGQQVFDRYGAEMLAALEQEPGPVKYADSGKLRWTSDKQRKFVMAMLRKENNLPYQRTHKLSQAWVVEYQIEGGEFIIRVQNTAPQAKFVYGSLAKNRGAALDFKQGFHTDTGWQTAKDTVEYHNRIIIDAFRAAYGEAVVFASRAYTKGSKRK